MGKKVPLTLDGKEIGTAEVDMLRMQIKTEITDQEALGWIRNQEIPLSYSIMSEEVALKSAPKEKD